MPVRYCHDIVMAKIVFRNDLYNINQTTSLMYMYYWSTKIAQILTGNTNLSHHRWHSPHRFEP